MRFAICQELFTDWDWERQCRFIASVGYTGSKSAPFTLAGRIGAGQPPTPASAPSAGRGQGPVDHWPALAVGKDRRSASHVGRRGRPPSDRRLSRRVGTCLCRPGGDLMVFGSPQQRSLQPGVTREQALANAAEVFREALPAIADRGVRICLEPLTPQETDFINTCAEAIELIDGSTGPISACIRT